MGISVSTIELLLRLRTAGYLTPGGAIVEIGAQQLGSSCVAHPERLQQLGRAFGINQPFSLAVPEGLSQAAYPSVQHIDFTAPFARDFWHWLGFEYAAIDIDGSPESIPLDLNYDSAPQEVKGKYKLVTNFGTTEHIANQLNAFNVIHDLTAPNKLIIHEVPTQGMFNHGLVNYNFKFFWLLIRSNGYKVIHADFMPAQEYYDLPGNIEEFLGTSKLSKDRRSYNYKVADAGMLIVVQKVFDIAFVPPLDVETGASTEIEALKKRYWTVFEEDPFAGLRKPEVERSNAAVRALDASASKASRARTGGQSVNAPVDSLAWKTEHKAPRVNQAALPDLAGAPAMNSRRGNAVINPWRILRRIVRNLANLDQLPLLVAQNDAIQQGNDAIREGIGNHADLMRRNLEAILKVMSEIRDIQKAQLFMQRSAAEALKQSATMLSPEPPAAGNRTGNS